MMLMRNVNIRLYFILSEIIASICLCLGYQDGRSWKDIMRTPLQLSDSNYELTSSEYEMAFITQFSSNSKRISPVPTFAPSPFLTTNVSNTTSYNSSIYVNAIITKNITNTTNFFSNHSNEKYTPDTTITNEIVPHRHETKSNICEPNHHLYILHLKDSASDGWHGAAFAIHEVNEQVVPKYAFKGSVPPNQEALMHFVCLKQNTCYRILVGGGDSFWHREISWEISIFGDGGYQTLISRGLAPIECTVFLKSLLQNKMPSNNETFTENYDREHLCPNTCHNMYPLQDKPSISPTTSKKNNTRSPTPMPSMPSHIMNKSSSLPSIDFSVPDGRAHESQNLKIPSSAPSVPSHMSPTMNSSKYIDMNATIIPSSSPSIDFSDPNSRAHESQNLKIPSSAPSIPSHMSPTMNGSEYIGMNETIIPSSSPSIELHLSDIASEQTKASSRSRAESYPSLSPQMYSHEPNLRGKESTKMPSTSPTILPTSDTSLGSIDHTRVPTRPLRTRPH